MSRTIRNLASVCLVLGLAVLQNQQSAQARRPSTVAAKSYCSGKCIGKLDSDKADDSIKLADFDLHRPATPVHVYKPLHVSLPHATKQLPKIASTQFER